MIECKVENITREGNKYCAMISFFDTADPSVEIGRRHQIACDNWGQFDAKINALLDRMQDNADNKTNQIKTAAQNRLADILAARRQN